MGPGEHTATVLRLELGTFSSRPWTSLSPPTLTVRDGPRGRVLASPRGAASSGSRGSLPTAVPFTAVKDSVRILVVSWQQALQDKGCKSKSQGTKDEKLPKRPAPAPRRDREAQEAGGTMNVEKTGKGGLPTDLERCSLKLALEGRLWGI